MKDRRPPTTTSGFRAWAQLVRLPNVFTILADVTAAFMLVLGGSGWASAERLGRVGWFDVIPTMLILWSAAVALYWGGMVLNDVVDVRRDARARLNRPLPRREIRYQTANVIAYGLLASGVVVAAWISSECVVLSILLVSAIVAYDGPLKRRWYAPFVMGICRLLSFSLGAATAVAAIEPRSGWQSATFTTQSALGTDIILGLPAVAMAAAIGMGTYVTGITTFARREAIGDRTIHLTLGLIGFVCGGAIIAFAPYLGDVGSNAWRVDAGRVFPIAIVLILMPTMRRAWTAQRNPSPPAIKRTIRSALLAIIPIGAAITMMAVGPIAGAAVLSLLVPSAALARVMAMT
ncbi:MAG: UbiA family prenyltransferase [Planctomycetota bacterium]